MAGAGGVVTYVDTSVASNTKYAYRVYAVNGPYQSSVNGPVGVITPTIQAPDVPPNPGGAPNGPYGLAVSATSPVSVSGSFTDWATNETWFVVERAIGDSGQYQPRVVLAASAGAGGRVTFTDDTVLPGFTYHYRVYAQNSLTYTSSVNGPVEVTTPVTGNPGGDRGTDTGPSNPGGAPNGPYGLTMSVENASAVTGTFTEYSDNETGFVVERSTSPSGPFDKVTVLPPAAGSGNRITFTDSGRQDGVTYYYRVYAANGGTYRSSINGPVAVTIPSGLVTHDATRGAFRLDQSFGNGTGEAVDASAPPALAVGVQNDGKVVVLTTTSQISVYEVLRRYNADGTRDATFGSGGSVSTIATHPGPVGGLAVLPDGKILVAGTQVNVGGRRIVSVLRFTKDGAPDNTFGPSGGTDNRTLIDVGADADVADVAVSPAGYILVGGSLAVPDAPVGPTKKFFAVRLLSNGTVDAAYGVNGVSQGNPQIGVTGTTVAAKADNTAVVAGGGRSGNTGFYYGNTMLADGTAGNTMFQALGLPTPSVDDSVAQVADGKSVLVGVVGTGSFAQRFNADGSIDAGWVGPGSITPIMSPTMDSGLHAVLPLSNGGFLIAGYAGPGNNTNNDFLIARLKTDGSVDASGGGTFNGTAGLFATNFGATDEDARAVALSPSNSIVVAGVSGGHLALVRYVTS